MDVLPAFTFMNVTGVTPPAKMPFPVLPALAPGMTLPAMPVTVKAPPTLLNTLKAVVEPTRVLFETFTV